MPSPGVTPLLLVAISLLAPLIHSRTLPEGCLERRDDAPPYPYCNLTVSAAVPTPLTPTATAAGNSTSLLLNSNCPTQTVYPSELRHMNSLYPDNQFSPTSLFMVLRESNDSFQLGTQIQFNPVPKEAKKCALVLMFPGPNTTDIRGLSPSMNVYQVEKEANTTASWSDSIFATKGIGIGSGNANITGAAPANVSAYAVGTVNGDPEAVERVRKAGGEVVVGYCKCNETLTFQVGMARPGTGPLVNYWGFVDVPAAATPEQGWRIMYVPEEC